MPHWSDGRAKPPIEFDHDPVPGAIILYVHYKSVNYAHNPDNPRKGLMKGWNFEAFTQQKSPSFQMRCMIVMPIPGELDKVSELHIYRHERAHCNGWHHIDE